MENVTVLMPVKDGARYLDKALSSLKKNISRDDEVLIIDDFSSDYTWEKLNNHLEDFPQLRIIKNVKSGLVNALNLGLREAKNEWIARFDVDDNYAEHRLELQRAQIREGVVAIFSDYSFWTRKGIFLGRIPSPIFPEATALSLLKSQRTAHPSVLLNKQLAIGVGGYRPHDFPSEDLSLWLRLTRVGDLISLPEELLYYQLSPTSVSSSLYSQAKKRSRELIEEIGLTKSLHFVALDKLQGSIDSYRTTSLSTERSFLHLLDINYAFRKFGEDSKLRKELHKSVLNFLAHHPEIFSYSKMAFWKMTRKLYRYVNQSKH